MDVEAEARAVTATLVARHPAFAAETIARLVRQTFDDHAGAAVTTYLPLLVRREVEARLRALDHDFVRTRPRPDDAGRRDGLPGTGTLAPTTVDRRADGTAGPAGGGRRRQARALP